jgi:energy-coupling factor transport system permease protein
MTGRGEGRLFRVLPGDTPVHRLWAGTKLVCLAALVVTLGVRPRWAGEAAVGTVLLIASAVARVPRSVVPRPPRWLWLAAAVAVALSVAAGGTAGLADVARFSLLTLLVVGAAALVGWTTSPAAVSPALARLGAPLRRLRVPVDEWAATVAVAIRSLPLIADEVRTLRAARRLRPAAGGRGHRARAREVVDLMVAALVVSARRARDLGQAMEARGGAVVAIVPPSAGPAWRDAVAFAVTATAVVTAAIA